MEDLTKKLLHPRVVEECETLFDQEHYKHAAHAAMVVVDIALKEKTGQSKLFGSRLISHAFGERSKIYLRVPFGEGERLAAEAYFQGAFKYYRNYTAHDGRKIQEIDCVRAMIVASELLELLNASPRSFERVGEDGLVAEGVFSSLDSLLDFLLWLERQWTTDDVWDGFFEALAYSEHSEDQMVAVMEVGLINLDTEYYDWTPDNEHPESCSTFNLTEQGRRFLTKHGRQIPGEAANV